VWISYALFEAEGIRVTRDDRGEDEDEEDESTWAKDEGDVEKAREIWQRGYKDLKVKGLKSEVSCFGFGGLWESCFCNRVFFCDSVLRFWKFGRRLRKVMGLQMILPKCRA
jgi:hypothetical protein